ncbi:MAG: DUF3105 domain-containing protein [bacterium]|nr:DUF3105 domain-containing protein [bacterium]
MPEELPRSERRRLKHEKRKAKKVQQEKTESRKSLKLYGVLFLIILIAAIWYFNRPAGTPNNEVEVEKMETEHIANTDDVEYNSNPPTSGPHFGDWHKDWRFYETELPVGGLIHNMEHGGVIIWYKSELDETSKAQLKEFTENNSKVIATVNEDIPAPIAMSAWGVYELFETFDETKFKRFYKDHRNEAPENIYP